MVLVFRLTFRIPRLLILCFTFLLSEMITPKNFLKAIACLVFLLPLTNIYGQEEWTQYTKEDGLVSDLFRRIETDTAGNLWIATYAKGLYKYDGENWILYTKTDGLLGNVIIDMLIDSQGNIWLIHGGFDNGISVFDGENWQKREFSGELNCITEGPDHRIYIGTGEESDEYSSKTNMNPFAILNRIIEMRHNPA